MSNSGNMWRQFDWMLLGVSVLLTAFGVLMIRSATLDAIDPDLINRVPNQIRYAVIGIGIMFALAALVMAARKAG